jgi:sugar lactone lactonase YvrE
MVEGTVFVIERDGRVTPLIADAELVSSIGIEVDEPRDRLLVANSDRRVLTGENRGQAKLAAYSLTSGERLAMIDLAAVSGATKESDAFFANDLAVDGDGNVYVTDMRQNAVYKVTADYEPAVLHRFGTLPEGAGLNGIVYADGGYLLVFADEYIYKIPVDEPAATTQVTVAEPVPGQDGAAWLPDGRLVVVSNSTREPCAVILASDDEWATAQRVASARLAGQATTVAVVGDDIYVVHPHFSDDDPPTLEQAVFH